MEQSPLIVIITASTGRETLRDTIESVQQQRYPNIRHLIVSDGEIHRERIQKIINTSTMPKKHDIQLMTIPWQTGLNNWVCHRIYAAIPHLIVEDNAYISFLDEDNYIDPEHYESLYTSLRSESKEWAFSLRKIVGQHKEYITHDMCENLGHLSYVWITYRAIEIFPELKDFNMDLPNFYLVDTNCYLIKKTLMHKISEHFQTPARKDPEADRLLFFNLNKIQKGACSMKYTLNYRIASREDSANYTFYLAGNDYMRNKYNNNIPWAPPQI
jgi:glycosyltransferase involved in cell wall biosynthesis